MLCLWFVQADPIESDPVEPVKPKQRKTRKQDLSQKPAGSTKTSTVGRFYWSQHVRKVFDFVLHRTTDAFTKYEHSKICDYHH